ncbi:MAG TPA: glycosyltransferase, partial [Nocardioides sp.]
DPAICLAHSRDRAQLRAKHGLDADLPLVGIFGVVGERKNAPMILAAMQHAGIDAKLVLAGKVAPEVQEWLDGLAVADRERIIVRHGFLPDDVLDEMVAAVDVVPLALTNNGPSGIMGKALAAEVPVVTAGSEVRAREIRATGGGVACELTVEALGQAMREVLEDTSPRISSVPPATADAFAETLLGL